MTTLPSSTERAKRTQAIADAAMLLSSPAREEFVAQTCADNQALRLEVEALIAHHAELSRLTPEERERVSGLFYAALNLQPAERPLFLDRACARLPEARREVESLLRHATDPTFLKGGPDLARDLTSTTVVVPISPPAGSGAPPPFRDPLIGRRIGPYVIQRKLGEGGMGVVYLALDSNLQKPVAIKVPRPEYARDPEHRARLINEARNAAAISHPNVASVYALFEDGDDVFIVCEYVDGPTLRSVISRGPLGYARLVTMLSGVARGLEAAHAKGIIHRDIKPENVMITGEDVPKIVDFGLAKSTRAIMASSTRVTRPGMKSGTPAYMAPEQIDETPGRPLDFRADIFAFGIMLYECASGIHPFEGSTWVTTLENIRTREAPKLPQLGNEVSRLEGLIQRCLRKNPEERYASTGALAADIESLRLSPPPPVTSDPWLWWWRFHQAAVAVAYCGTVAWLYLVRTLTQPAKLVLPLVVLAAVAAAVNVTLRFFLFFASGEGRSREFNETCVQVGAFVRAADWTLVVPLAIMAGLLLVVSDRPGTAFPMIIAAAVYLVLFLVVEPWTARRALRDGTSGSRS